MSALYYFEIQANQPERAKDFYTTVFGWKFELQPDMPIPYWLIEGAGIPGGLLGRPVPVPSGPSGTNAYVCSMQVDDFDATAKVVLAQGGIVAMEKFAVPGKCWQGYFLDPEGNTFGVFQPDTDAA